MALLLLKANLEKDVILMITCMRKPEMKEFIDDHQHLFWYSPAPKVDEQVIKDFLI